MREGKKIIWLYTERIKLGSLLLQNKKMPTEGEEENLSQFMAGLEGIEQKLPTTTRPILWIDVAFSHIHMIIINIFCPVTSVFWNAYLQPWFHVAIIVYNGCSINLLLAYTRVITKAQHMPWAFKWICVFPKSYKTRWQRSQLPQLSIMVLNKKENKISSQRERRHIKTGKVCNMSAS